MSLIPFGFWAASGAGGVSYWLSTLGGAVIDTGTGVVTDSSGNSYVAGWTNSPGTKGMLLTKQDSAGVIQWQRTLGANNEGRAVAIDSSDNLYVAIYTSNFYGSSRTDFVLAKYNSSGVIQWQRKLGGALEDEPSGIAVDSSENSYIIGFTASTGAGGRDLLLAKYNSSGTIQWQRILGGAGNDFGTAAAVDSAGNVYVSGYQGSAGAGNDDFLIAKYNSSGTIQWQRILGGSGTDQSRGLAFDSFDNPYVVGTTTSAGAGGIDGLLARYDSSGSIQWQRLLGASSSDEFFSIAFDSSDNFYAVGETQSQGQGSSDFLIAKYNSSGTIQWQRIIGGATEDGARSVFVDAEDNLHIVGTSNSTGEGGNDVFYAKLPSDGSLTGTYVLDGVSIVYAVSTLSPATSTLTAATSSLTASTSSLTSSTTTFTDASGSLTQHLVEL